MIYKDRTFENIIKEMLDRVPNQFDKRQGSIIYDALAPAAAELAQTYIDLNYLYMKLDAENLEGKELELFVNQRTGIERKKATKAVRKGMFSKADGSFFNAEIGTRFTGGDNYFKTISKIEDGVFELESENPGSLGGSYSGRIIPIEYIKGLAKAELIDIVESGYDAESDESLLVRYYERIRTPATSGNKYHYLNWAKEVVGVGDAKVIPLWNGNGTVKVVIVDSSNNPANSDLITKVERNIADSRPIGATETVVSAIAKDITVKAKVSLVSGHKIQLVQNKFKAALEEYRKKSGFKDSYISYAAVNNVLFNVPGVLDSNNLTLNEEMKNIALKDEEIAIFKKVELEVM